MSSPTDDILRSVNTSEIVSRFTTIASQIGMTRLAPVTGLDRLGLPVAAAYRPNARSISVNHGKGLSEDAAKASAAGEAIEVYHAETIDLDVITVSYLDLLAERSIADPYRLPQPVQGTFATETPMDWITGYTLDGEQERMVPLESVSLDFTYQHSGKPGAFLASSSGMGTGSTLAEACLHGICELIERDAHTMWLLRGKPFQEKTRIDINTIKNADCRNILDTCLSKDLLVGAWNLTSDIQMPVIMFALVERERQAPSFVPYALGTGCHPDPGIAAVKALTEAVQMRLTQITSVRDDLKTSDYLSENETFWTNKKTEILKENAYQAWPSEEPGFNLHECLEFVIRELHVAGLSDTCFVDLSKPALGIPVVKMVVPGLEDGIEGEDQRRGERAMRALMKRAEDAS